MNEIKYFFSTEHITHLIEHYSSLGLIVGFLWPFIDSYIAMFPLILIVTVNVNAFGFWEGFLVSYIGSVTGTIGMFFLVRHFGHKLARKILYRPGKNNRLMSWVDEAGFGPFFLLISLPFTPSFLLNVFTAISRVKTSSYLPASILGKFIMILTISYIGNDIKSYGEHPIKLLVPLVLLGLLWKVGKLVEGYLNKGYQNSKLPLIENESKIN